MEVNGGSWHRVQVANSVEEAAAWMTGERFLKDVGEDKTISALWNMCIWNADAVRERLLDQGIRVDCGVVTSAGQEEPRRHLLGLRGRDKGL